MSRKLTDEDVINICKSLNKGSKLKDLALYYGVSLNAISYIKSGRTHKKITNKFLEKNIKDKRISNSSRGTNHYKSKLTEDDIKAIRAIAKKAEESCGCFHVDMRKLATLYGVSRETIYRVIEGDRYREVQ